MKLARTYYGRVVHLIDAKGYSVCGRRVTRSWVTAPSRIRGYPTCRLCAKGDRLRMPTR